MESLKETKLESTQPHGRWYRDACGTAFAMELVGERWSMLIVRELLLGPRRFSDLRAALPGISAKVLTERLAGLEASGVLLRRRLPPPAASQVYELTEWGRAAEAPILSLGRWAAMSRAHDPRLPLSPAAFMLSLKTMLNYRAAERLTLCVGFTVGGESFLAELEGGALAVSRAALEEAAAAPAHLAAPEPLPLLRLFYGHRPLAEVEEMGVAVAGDRTVAERFAHLFALPEKLG